MRIAHLTWVGAMMGAVCLPVAPGRAASMAEYFNDYGPENRPIHELNGGEGWAGPWTWANAEVGPAYLANRNLTASVRGYENTGNLTGENHGQMGVTVRDTGRNTDIFASRPTGGLTGTVWISAVYQVQVQGRGMRIGFDSDGTAPPSTWVHLQRGNPHNDPVAASYGSAAKALPFDDYGPLSDGPHVLIVRLVIDDEGEYDSMDIWARPGNVSSIEAMGEPDLSFSGQDVLGDSFDRISICLNNVEVGDTRFGLQSLIDAIRISNDPVHGFAFVTTGTPEPATTAAPAAEADP